VWDNQNSIFLSGRSHELEYRLRIHLLNLQNNSKQELELMFSQTQEIKKTIQLFDELKLSLKADIGIYRIEFSDEAQNFKKFEDIAKKVFK
jgi:hypothetical protein